MTSGRVDTSKGKQRKLTRQQVRFVEEYLVDMNSIAAARRAGYACKTIGPQLLGKPHISAAIGIQLGKRSERTRLTADEVIARLRREADRVGGDSSHAGRVKAIELLCKLGGFISDTHLHKHFEAARDQQNQISQEQVLDALPLETRVQLLDTVKRLQAKRLAETPAQTGDVIEVVTPLPDLIVDSAHVELDGVGEIGAESTLLEDYDGSDDDDVD